MKSMTLSIKTSASAAEKTPLTQEDLDRDLMIAVINYWHKEAFSLKKKGANATAAVPEYEENALRYALGLSDWDMVAALLDRDKDPKRLDKETVAACYEAGKQILAKVDTICKRERSKARADTKRTHQKSKKHLVSDLFFCEEIKLADQASAAEQIIENIEELGILSPQELKKCTPMGVLLAFRPR